MESTILGIGNEAVMMSVTYELSPDMRYLLVSRNNQRVFRHSTVAMYDAIDIATNVAYPISANGTHDFIFLAEWGPVGNAIVFVENNNIYYKSNAIAAPVQITTEGSRSINYGTCDWVYEGKWWCSNYGLLTFSKSHSFISTEEVFASKTALWFSPDGNKLAYMRFDDRNVHLMNIPIYGVPGSIESQYTSSIGIHYPKVGSTNPTVSLFTVDLSTTLAPGQVPTSVALLAPETLRNEDHIISAVGWQNNQSVAASWMNRVQNRAVIQTCEGSNCRVVSVIYGQIDVCYKVSISFLIAYQYFLEFASR